MLRLNFLGDLFVSNSQNLESLIKSFKEFYSSGDINFLNLEGPVSKAGTKSKGKIVLNMDISSLEFVLDELNINVVNLANNHIFDYGLDGYIETINFLKRKNINFFGAGLDLEEARKPLIVEINNLKVAFLGYSWGFIQSVEAKKNKFGTAPIDEKFILEDIEKIRDRCDFLVVSLHWNYERERFPLPSFRKLAHLIIDRGASIIVGHHPHVPQGVETFQNKPIAYSLGNFYFDNFVGGKYTLEQAEEKREGILVEVYLNKRNDFSYQCKHFKHNFKRFVLIDNSRSYLSKPLLLDDEKYLQFWRKNRVRKDLPDMFKMSRYGKCVGKLALTLFKLTGRIKRLLGVDS